MNEITFEDFTKVALHVGTVVTAAPNRKARVPAYILTIDFGDLGIKTSSAQITENYAVEELINTQVIAVMNFPSKRVAGVKSEVLVLASVNDETGTVLLTPTKKVPNGAKIR